MFLYDPTSNPDSSSARLSAPGLSVLSRFLAVSFVVVVFSASACSQHVAGDSLTPPVGLSLLFQMSH